MSMSLGYPTAAEEQSLLSKIGLDHPVEPGQARGRVRGQRRARHGSTSPGRPPRPISTARSRPTSSPSSGRPEAIKRSSSGPVRGPRLRWRPTARALAAVRGRDYVLPDDVKELAVPVIAHRLVLSPEGPPAGYQIRAGGHRHPVGCPGRAPDPDATSAVTAAFSSPGWWRRCWRSLYAVNSLFALAAALVSDLDGVADSSGPGPATGRNRPGLPDPPLSR